MADVSELRAALERAFAGERSSIVEVRNERARNVELHGRVWDAVSGALSPPAAGSSAASLTSVSASSAAGSDSATMPLPA